MMNNLFEFATKELSQDAFICWFLNFAHKNHLGENKVIQECAIEFLKRIIESKYTIEDDIVVTKIIKQYKNIDVLVEVNDQYNIIIEDKTFTQLHGNQIYNYKRELENEGISNIITVYYKIVEQNFKEDVDININRQFILNIFDAYIEKTDNNIFNDYYNYLQKIDEQVNSYTCKPIDNWNEQSHAYKGFFVNLINSECIKLNRNYGWGYVPNKSGGFWGLWWNFFLEEDLKDYKLKEQGVYEVHLQIENDRIALKICSKQNINNLKWEIFNYIDQKVDGYKKNRFRNGKVMTVGYINYNEKNYMGKIKLMESIIEDIVKGKFY